MIWARYELTRRIRAGILKVMGTKGLSLNDQDVIQTVLDELLVNRSKEKPFGIFHDLRGYFRSLLHAAERRLALQKLSKR